MAAFGFHSIAELQQRYQGGYSLIAEVKRCLSRIHTEDDRYRAMVFVGSEDALDSAAQLEKRIQNGANPGLLHGVPIAVKDVIDVQGWPTTAGSNLFGGRMATEDAACVCRLREAGAIIIGKTNLHELTVGGHDNPWFGKVANPLDVTCGTGGTSSGSAAAVRAGFCLAALGTDTGGSNRSPAAATGLVGFKPESLAVERTGVLPSAPSFDAIGPITLSLADAWLVTSALEGRKQRELETVSPSGLRIGLCADLYGAAVDPVVAQAYGSWLERAERAGATIKILRFPAAEQVREAGKAILFYEFKVRYGGLVREHPDRVGPTVLNFLSEAAAFGHDAYEAALAFRAKIRAEFLDLLSTVDLLVTPVAPGLAPQLADETTRVGADRVSYGLAGGSFRRWANFFDLPTLAIPVPSTGALPASIQVCASPGMTRMLFASCHALSQTA